MNSKVYNREKKTICPNCNSEKAIKWTKRKTENRGLIQRYKCKDCEKTFTIDDGFFRMRNHPKKITCALDLFYRGVSTRKVQEHFQAFYPHNSSHKTVYKWVVKYAQWKRRVFILDLAEDKVRRDLADGKITKIKHKKIKKVLGKEWLKNWDYYPDKNPSVEQAFKNNFL